MSSVGSELAPYPIVKMTIPESEWPDVADRTPLRIRQPAPSAALVEKCSILVELKLSPAPLCVTLR